MQFGWIVAGPGSTWLGDVGIVRDFRQARVFHDPRKAKTVARQIFPKGNLTLYYLEAQAIQSTSYSGDWETIEN